MKRFLKNKMFTYIMNINIASIVIQLCVMVVIYVVAVYVGAFIKINKEFYYPVIFGLMYGNYLAISLYYKRNKN